MADGKFDLEKLPPSTPIDIAAREVGGLRPGYPGSYGYGYNYGQGEQKIHLRELWRTVRKRKWLIFTIAFVVTTLVTVEMYRTKNSYQAWTTVEIGKDTTRFGAPGSVFGDDYDPFYMINMKTKMLMIKSHTLLESVVVNNKLDQNPRFVQASGKKSVWEALKLMGAKVGITDRGKDSDEERADSTIIPLTPPGDARTRTPEEKARLDRAIAILDGGLGVEPIKEARALKISFTHADPEIAADVANSVAAAFLSRNFENKTQKFTDAAKWLDESTRKLKAKAQEAEEKLADYTRDHGIFLTDKEGTLTTTKLSRLHDEVLRAESDRMLKQSLFDEVKQGRVQKNPEAYADLLFKTS
ncbi:MAG TPA: Wzz/FepE/Etk N-terminal domain-containing protein, partial [Blastocatellia bacterium]|nr:Wzz/FepE/Etk N-terminal domain-containing protein [Blastocatellia bacterium]